MKTQNCLLKWVSLIQQILFLYAAKSRSMDKMYFHFNYLSLYPLSLLVMCVRRNVQKVLSPKFFKKKTNLLMCVCSFVSSSDPMNCSPPGSSVHGISQARLLVWVAIFYSRVSCTSRRQTWVSWVSFICRRTLYHYTSWVRKIPVNNCVS